jgi:hypothetical protein
VRYQGVRPDDEVLRERLEHDPIKLKHNRR